MDSETGGEEEFVMVDLISMKSLFSSSKGMTIGNIHSHIRNKPSNHAWIPIAFLPIPPKRVGKIPGYKESQQELDALSVFHQCISSP